MQHCKNGIQRKVHNKIKKPCVFRFETFMILVMDVSDEKITYRIIRDKG
jgi:hypothetical protein